jgi:alpha-glucosidase/alpha-D-xyloside xylohydrolase
MFFFKAILFVILLSLSVICQSEIQAKPITVNGKPGILEIREAEKNCIRITLKPDGYMPDLPYTPALADRVYLPPAIQLYKISSPVKKRVANLNIEITPDPLKVIIKNSSGELVQLITFNNDGGFSFSKSSEPILGMGEGGSLPGQGITWRTLPVQFDRNGSFDEMVPRWQGDAYGSRNPVPLMVGTEGWAIFVATPWGQIDLRDKEKGLFIPQDQEGQKIIQGTANQSLNQGKGLPPAENYVKGVLDIFVFDASDPPGFMKELSLVSGQAVLPPLWALGYMQSHRTLIDENQIIGIVDTFRAKRIPVDAVIYLGTGFCPRGWNTKQPSFEFNPDVFKRKPEEVLADLHKLNVKVIVHIVPWDRDKLPTLHGTIPAVSGELMDISHIQNYWQQHTGLMEKGVDAFWPDEGDWFNLFERIKRHQMYYQGPISTKPNVRPWSLHRNGFLGIAKWGGWVWSGDTQSSWKTLEAQIAVGINYSLSLSPFWGSDIGGFSPGNELTGELYARWFQFGAFCSSFRSHGRTWWTRLPWGWGLNEMGPLESNTNPLKSELNNPAIEPVCKKYAELRYQLLPYTYTLAWEARATGLPLMRAMWLHYPDDKKAVGLGNQYMWGRDLLIAPVYEKGATSRTTYLPKGLWYDWWSGEKIEGGKDINRKVDLSIMPIYVRAGAIIPFDPIRQYTGEKITEPTTIKVFTGSDGQFTLYEDDGISLDYLKGIGRWTGFAWNEKLRTLTIEPDAPAGSVNTLVKREFILELKPEGKIKRVTFDGSRQSIKF